MRQPDIFEFLNVHHFLQQMYAYRKFAEKNFSYQMWAEEMGIKDRSYLRQVVMGKRGVNAEMIERFLLNMKLNELEQQYFHILNEYSTTTTNELRDELGKKLIGLIKQKETL
ncbi:TIGR02147 family protein [Bdellovibrio sp. NC01]|uniref:TIGR02147 family protein n=1 Tax=Bdellovibrio sp. NC01 TaxID=2220073 RepID=UPI0011588762|nr:TIGR02147 family protein [Bdellovibrio sp. NC01]QDK38605.1 hypothetical protein DOE51_13955 [Bdellovibrio sp. NC01]